MKFFLCSRCEKLKGKYEFIEVQLELKNKFCTYCLKEGFESGIKHLETVKASMQPMSDLQQFFQEMEINQTQHENPSQSKIYKEKVKKEMQKASKTSKERNLKKKKAKQRKIHEFGLSMFNPGVAFDCLVSYIKKNLEVRELFTEIVINHRHERPGIVYVPMFDDMNEWYREYDEKQGNISTEQKRCRNPDEVWKKAYWMSHDDLLETYGNTYLKCGLYQDVLSQIVNFEEYLVASKNSNEVGMFVSVFIRLQNNIKYFPHIDLALHSWKICIFAANSIMPVFDRQWLMEANAETANIKQEYEGGDVYKYAATDVCENFAYDIHHCENCNRIGYSSEIQQLFKNLPEFQNSFRNIPFGNGNFCKDLKLCARCEKAFYCSVKCQHEHWKIHKKKCKKKKKKKKKNSD